MWQILTFLFLGTTLLFAWWCQRRGAWARENARQLNEEIASLHKSQHEIADQVDARQRALFNNMMEGVLWLDSHRQVRLINDALADLLEITGNVNGRPITEVVRLPQLAQIIDLTEREGHVQDYEFELPGLDGRQLEVNAVLLSQQPKIDQGIILVFHDLTRLKELENTRKEFVANVSHELRTPLSMIKGYVETLLSGAKDDPEVADRFLQIIAKHTTRLTFLIEDLLTLSRLDSGRIRSEESDVSLQALVEKVVTELSERASADNIEIETNIPADTVVRGDADRIYQVFMNLIDNAIKYGRPGGTISVHLKEQSTDWATVSVDDNGPGIPEAMQERIFERFFRADSSRSRDQGGTGLGLAIVKHIVQMHGGNVWVESQPNAGSKFVFTLPRSSPSNA